MATFVFELPFITGGVLTLVGAWLVYRYVTEVVRPSEAGAAGVQGERLAAEND